MISRSAIKWQCRRGKLELDIVLRRFTERYLEGMSEAELIHFQQLLAHTDDDLLDWILMKSSPPESELREMLERIRDADPPEAG